MATTYLTITIDTAQANAWFDYAGYKSRDARDPFRQVAYDVILPAIEEQFATEGARTSPWRPLNLEYQKRRFAAGYFGPILERTGAGKSDALNPFNFRIHKDHMTYRLSNEGQVAEDGVEYMHWHQTGGYDPGHPPRRPFVVLNLNDREQIQMIFEMWLDELRTLNTRRFGAAVLPPIPSIDILR